MCKQRTYFIQNIKNYKSNVDILSNVRINGKHALIFIKKTCSTYYNIVICL